MAMQEAGDNERIPLIQGRNMVCPRCEQPHDLLHYRPLGFIDKFVEDTTPVYKCPSCRWIFAPAENTLRAALGVSAE